MHFLRCLVIAVGLLQSSFDREAFACQELLDYSQSELAHWGVLSSIPGFVYVSVDDAYIHELVKFIEPEGFVEPPYFGPGLVGAHITAIYPHEIEKYGIGEISECGTTVHFEIKGCQVVQPPKWHEIEQVYFIAVDAPQLDQLREKYGLPKTEYDFHITVGVKARGACCL